MLSQMMEYISTHGTEILIQIRDHLLIRNFHTQFLILALDKIKFIIHKLLFLLVLVSDGQCLPELRSDYLITRELMSLLTEIMLIQPGGYYFTDY